MALTKVHNRMVAGSVFNVIDYGATGDGSTDDTASINACFSAAATYAAANLSKGVTIFFPSGDYKITDTLVPPRAFSNEGFMNIMGEAYLSTSITWAGSLNRIMIDASNQPRFCMHDFTLNGGPSGSKPAYGLAHWGATAGQHASHQEIYNLIISDMKVGMAGQMTESYVDSSGATVSPTPGFGSQDSIYRNVIIQNCDIGLVSGHTHNKYENFRLTNTLNMKVITASFATYDNCFFGGADRHVLLYDQNNAGAINLQNFNNCWFESAKVGGGHICFDVQANSVSMSAAAVISNSNVADSEYLCSTNSSNVYATIICTGPINFGAGGVTSTNKFNSAAGSTCEIKFSDPSDLVFIDDGSGTLIQNTFYRPVISSIKVGDYDVVSKDVILGVSSYGATSQSVKLGTYNTSNVFSESFEIAKTGEVYPGGDGVRNLGAAGRRWATVYATTGTINTSDENEKQDIRDISVAEKAVASTIKSQMKAFRFKDAFEKKGDDARIHFGVIAQSVSEAFEAEGLDANRYGVFCSDTWWTDADGNVFDAPDDGLTEHNRLGVRYEELFAFIISTL